MKRLVCLFLGHDGARFATLDGYVCRRCGARRP